MIFKAVKDNYYRISAEGLRVCSELVRVLRPEVFILKYNEIDYQGTTFNFKAYVPDLYNSTLEKLKVQDIDQEVKESAINCTGLIFSTFADELKSELKGVLLILQERYRVYVVGY